jgi:hypothetical protein
LASEDKNENMDNIDVASILQDKRLLERSGKP